MRVNYKLKKELLSKEMGFLGSAVRTSKILGVKNAGIKETMGITKTISERMENNM
jgi:hypothetical protein